MEEFKKAAMDEIEADPDKCINNGLIMLAVVAVVSYAVGTRVGANRYAKGLVDHMVKTGHAAVIVGSKAL